MITIKTKKDIEKMRAGGKILAFVLKSLAQAVKPGISLLELEALANKLISEKKAEPSFKGYKGYPAALCTSVNENVVHCIPNSYVLKVGDIIGIDCGIKYQGLYTDSAVTIGVGAISSKAEKLIRVTKEALNRSLKQIKEGNYVGDIGHAIQEFVEKRGFYVVTSLVGHGVGYDLHEEPRIPNYGKPHHGPKLAAGMTICIEPMVNVGTSEVEFSNDGWTVTTKDRSLSAHFEHTILVTKNKPEILTKI